MAVSELKPFSRKVDLVVKIVNIGEVREVTVKTDGSAHRVTEALAGDESGTVLLTLWDDMIDAIKVGKSYKISNGYVSTFRNSMRLNVGRYGQFEECEEQFAAVNEQNNISGSEAGE